MKRVVGVLLALFVMLPAAAFAGDRFDKGSWRVGVALDSVDSSLTPSIGYFLADNLEIAVHLDSSVATISNPGAADDELESAEVGAVLRYSFPVGGSVVPVIGAGLASYTETEKSAGSTTSDLEGSLLMLSAGVRFLVGEIGSVDLTLAGAGGTVDDNVAGTSHDVSVGSFSLSYSLYF
ncbi:MAG: hypothetical protein HZA24_03975 [Nitrospirae bacterium]|nr:hypothetical protein [Nitrospirota bacterium]